MVCGKACEDCGPKHDAVHRPTCGDAVRTGEIFGLKGCTSNQPKGEERMWGKNSCLDCFCQLAKGVVWQETAVEQGFYLTN